MLSFREETVARFLFVNQFYWPDFAATAQQLTDVAQHLAASGHEVHVLCSRGRYLEGRGKAPARERHQGVVIHRVPATSFGKGTRMGRLFDYLSFHLWTAVFLPLLPRADVTVSLTTPPWIGCWATCWGRIRRQPQIAYVMDLYPEVLFAARVLSPDSFVGRLLSRINRFVLRSAECCVVLGPRQGQRVLSLGVEPHKIVTIPGWCSFDLPAETPASPHARESSSRRDNDSETRPFVVMYSGNAGVAHRFDEVLEAARRLQDAGENVIFRFVGRGSRTRDLMKTVQEELLRNVRFENYVATESLAESLASADVHLVTLREQFDGVLLPVKIHGAWGAARPVIAVVPDPSDSAQLVHDSKAGIVAQTGEAIARAILRLRDHPSERRVMGERGRDFVRRFHTAEVCGEAWRVLLESIVHEPVEPNPVEERVLSSCAE